MRNGPVAGEVTLVKCFCLLYQWNRFVPFRVDMYLKGLESKNLSPFNKMVEKSFKYIHSS